MRCDACVSSAPTWRLDIPPGTPLFVATDSSGARLAVTAGSFGLCDECKRIFDQKVDVALRWVDRMFLYNPTLQNGTKEACRIRRRASIQLYARLAALLSNPRPFVAGEHCMDGKKVEL